MRGGFGREEWTQMPQIRRMNADQKELNDLRKSASSALSAFNSAVLLVPQPAHHHRRRSPDQQCTADDEPGDAIAAILLHRAHRLVAGVCTQRQQLDYSRTEQSGLRA